MGKKPFCTPGIIFFFFLFILICMLPPSPGVCQESPAAPDAIVKVSELNAALEAIDEMARGLPNQAQLTPSVFIRSMLQGTEWIDPDRSIVLGAFFTRIDAESMDFAALIPFRTANDDFQMAYNAVAGGDYYIVSLPPGKGGIVSDRMETALVEASLKPPEGMLSVDVAAAQVLQKAEPDIRKKISELEAEMADTEAAGISPDQVREMISGLIDTGRQIQTLSMGLDLGGEEVSFFSKVAALSGTRLAEALKGRPEEEELLLADYQPAYEINFRSRPYDMAGVISFIDTHFGGFYDPMGIDFGELGAVMKYFSGEMAGGASFTEAGMDLEIISILDPAKELPENYLKEEYVPWFLEYGEALADYMNRQAPEIQMETLVEKLPDSTVDGRPVFGVKLGLPAPAESNTADLEITMRMTRVDNMVLTASSDRILSRLIEKAKALDKKTAGGPLMEMDMDLAAYLNAVQRFMPDEGVKREGGLPSMGKLRYSLDVSGGELRTRYSIDQAGIRRMLSHLGAMARTAPTSKPGKKPRPRRREEPKEQPSSGQSVREVPQKEAAASEPDKSSPQYWLNKGELVAVYGNDKRAVEYFRKAAELDPQNSRAFFQLAVSYGALGNHQQALEAVNRAISMRPGDGNYYYARGWIYLLAGEKDRAVSDMKRAAELDNTDAIAYLESIRNR
jgi:tetratricopeptide (TPR) repeat protein